MSRVIAIATLAFLVLLTLAKVHAKTTHKQIKVAVIDTGMPQDRTGLCADGHINVSLESMQDTNLHSTNVSGLIHRYAGDSDYCQIMIKFYTENADGTVNTDAMIRAIDYAIDSNVDIINISGGGPVANTKERLAILRALNKGIKIIVAAGNDSTNLDNKCNYFPACYDPRITVIGNNRNDSSTNYGSIVDKYIDGNHKCSKGVCLSGSSQATAIFTGKLVKELHSRTTVN